MVLERVPASIRGLARDADVPHTTLLAVRDGDLNLSPAKTVRLVATLRRWAGECSDLADLLEDAAERRGDQDD